MYVYCNLQQVSENGSELLLDSAERYGLVLARTQDSFESPQRLSRPNIGKYNTMDDVTYSINQYA